jgi:hypothetical protein
LKAQTLRASPPMSDASLTIAQALTSRSNIQ